MPLSRERSCPRRPTSAKLSQLPVAHETCRETTVSETTMPPISGWLFEDPSRAMRDTFSGIALEPHLIEAYCNATHQSLTKRRIPAVDSRIGAAGFRRFEYNQTAYPNQRRSNAKMKYRLLLFGVFLLPLTACIHPAFGQPKAVYVQVRVDSEANGYEGVNALDGNPNTMWHTQFRQSNPKHPHEIVIDLGRSYEISGFEYLPRPGGGNGTIKDYEFYVSDSDEDFGQPVAKGTFRRSQSVNGVKIGSRKKGRYVKLVALSEMQGRPWTSIAGLEILSDGVAFRTESSRSAVAQRCSVRRKSC